jgi:hypothetical protein
MPIEYNIIQDKNLILVKGSGIITGRDALNHLADLSKDDRYVSPMKKFIDYRLVQNITVTSDEAWQIADKKKALSTIFHGEKCAFVSPKDISFGASRMHQTLVEGADLSTEVFRNVEDGQGVIFCLNSVRFASMYGTPGKTLLMTPVLQ